MRRRRVSRDDDPEVQELLRRFEELGRREREVNGAEQGSRQRFDPHETDSVE